MGEKKEKKLESITTMELCFSFISFLNSFHQENWQADGFSSFKQ